MHSQLPTFSSLTGSDSDFLRSWFFVILTFQNNACWNESSGIDYASGVVNFWLKSEIGCLLIVNKIKPSNTMCNWQITCDSSDRRRNFLIDCEVQYGCVLDSLGQQPYEVSGKLVKSPTRSDSGSGLFFGIIHRTFRAVFRLTPQTKYLF